MEPSKKAAIGRINSGMIITIQGHTVTLDFAEDPNTQVAAKIKQALRTYLTTGK